MESEDAPEAKTSPLTSSLTQQREDLGPPPSGTFPPDAAAGGFSFRPRQHPSELPERPLIKRHQGQLSHSRAGRIYGPKSFTNTSQPGSLPWGKPLWSSRVIKRSVSFSKPAPLSLALRWFCDKNIMKTMRGHETKQWVNPASEKGHLA